MSHFERVELAPADPILGLTVAFQNDARENKVNLGVGLYKTQDLKTPIFPDFCHLVRFQELGQFAFVKVLNIGL